MNTKKSPDENGLPIFRPICSSIWTPWSYSDVV